MAYVDDVVILVSGKFLLTLRELMESALRTLSSCSTNYGLDKNLNKTDLVLSPHKHNIEMFTLPCPSVDF